ncbi:helicase-related protein [Fretibacter rubidus]|uniref:helicase-related protein n=1 Tax=Fretibacter rubidus TaxID=570162 RepID=UPI00352A590A
MASSENLNPARIAAILGPTNTGKTHYAVERMLARGSGVIGLPLRLLAREVYDKICAIKPANQCALITGEEKIIPPNARYFVCTVEAMPMDRRFSFLAVDEIQLMGNFERGHIFTDRLLNARGTEETLFLGAETARPIIRELLPRAQHDTRERFSTLTYAGATRITRLPKRSVIVAFSAAEVYAIAELIRRQRGGAAVVMGGLSPRTRNAQAELYQSGEVDFLIATDAVGMGLNLDTDHVAFASIRKYDGRRRRMLTPMELGQIAGRAGRFRNEGTFGTTGDCPELDPETIERIENHDFDPMTHVEWRNSALDFRSIKALDDSLHIGGKHRRLRRVKGVTDELAFERLSAIPEIQQSIKIPADVRRLWDVCQIPDFRNVTIDAHVRLLQDIYRLLQNNKHRLPDDYMNKQVSRLDDPSGGVDILSSRLAQIRTWTYCANKVSWMWDAKHWNARTREVEDRLSDALHESLIARFVDRRTSALLKNIGLGNPMETSVKDNGEVWVDGHKIGYLDGVDFRLDDSATDLEAKALQATAAAAVGPEIDRRLTSLCGGTHAIFTLDDTGRIMWGGKAVGRIASSGSVFNPDAELIGGALGNQNLQNLAVNRMRDFLKAEVTAKLEPLLKLKALSESPEALPATRGFAFSMLENFGYIDRAKQGQIVRDLDQDARKQLREVGVYFGQYTVFMRDMIKPKPATLLSLLLSYGAGGDKKPFIPFAGVTSIQNEGELSSTHYTDQALAVAGYRACGTRIVRFDILDRLANLIRQAMSEAGGRKFVIMQEMLALLGSSYDDTRGVLQSLGYKSEEVEVKPEAKVEEPAKAEEPEKVEDAATEAATTETPAPIIPASENPAAPTVAETPAAEAPKADAPAVDAPKPAPKPKSGPKPLSPYTRRETLEDGTQVDLPTQELWTMPFKKRGGGRPDNRGNDNRAFKGKGKPKGNFKGKPRGDRNNTPRDNKPKAPKERPRKIEDSPFAALAALKNLKKD